MFWTAKQTTRPIINRVVALQGLRYDGCRMYERSAHIAAKVVGCLGSFNAVFPSMTRDAEGARENQFAGRGGSLFKLENTPAMITSFVFHSSAIVMATGKSTKQSRRKTSMNVPPRSRNKSASTTKRGNLLTMRT